MDLADQPPDPCSLVTPDQVSTAMGTSASTPAGGSPTYLPGGQRYCIWKLDSGGIVTLMIVTRTSLEAATNAAHLDGQTLEGWYNAAPPGESVGDEVGTTAVWSTELDALDGDVTFRLNYTNGEDGMKRQHLIDLGKQVVEGLVTVGAVKPTTTTAP